MKNVKTRTYEEGVLLGRYEVLELANELNRQQEYTSSLFVTYLDSAVDKLQEETLKALHKEQE